MEALSQKNQLENDDFLNKIDKAFFGDEARCGLSPTTTDQENAYDRR